jgi:RNA polymerase sigma factor (sigma-70 family)
MPILYFGRKRKDSPVPRTVSGAEARGIFEAHYVELAGKGRRLAARFVDDDADDVVQEAMLDLWSSCFRDGEVDPVGVKEVFMQILRRRIVDRMRQLQRESRRDDEHVTSLTERIERRMDVARVAEDKELPTRLSYIVAALPEACRNVYTTVTSHDGDVRAAAQELGITYNTARWHMTRANERIRKSLERDGYEVPRALAVGRPATGDRRDA